MKRKIKVFILIVCTIMITGTTISAQGIYSEDFLNAIECHNFDCFEQMVTGLNYTLLPEYSAMGKQETFQCNVTNEDGGRDMLNFAIYITDSSAYDELMFATDRYHTYDALKTGLIVNAFVSYSTATRDNGALQTFYYSSLYPGITMITQTFSESPEGTLMQYYITLQINRSDLK